MSIEIERRFLIKNNIWKNFIIDQSIIEQGYFLSNSNGWIIRIRSEREKFKLTFKKHKINFSSYEFEYEIPNTDGMIFLSNLKNRIKKERFYLFINKKNWIVDCFKGENFPLEIAEIELNDEKEKIEIPNFISKEITGVKKLSNFQLAQTPLSNWNKKDLKNFFSI